MNSIILIEDGLFYEKSDAFLRIVKNLDGYWPILRFIVIVPQNIRNFIYDKIAQNRYRMFGKKNMCLIPKPDIRQRFLQT